MPQDSGRSHSIGRPLDAVLGGLRAGQARCRAGNEQESVPNQGT